MKTLLTFLFLSTLMIRTSHAETPSFKKVMVFIFENTNYSVALKQPFFSSIAKEGAVFQNFIAEAHPSQPNYIALVAGDTLGVKGDSSVNLDKSSIADLLESHGKTWKVYAENYPGKCFQGASEGKYARKHVPLISFKNIQSDPTRCANIVEATQLQTDAAADALPDFSLYIPNLNNDGHDTGPAYADKWFSQAFKEKFADPTFMKDLLIVVTFDESETAGVNKIFTAFYGSSVKPGSVVTQKTTHYDILKTIEDTFGLGNLGRNDLSTAGISGIWN